MKLTFIIELLLVFILLAFAASAAVIDKHHVHKPRKALRLNRRVKSDKQRQESPTNKYCNCSAVTCNCCRDFNIPLVALKGPGCATLQYLNGDKLAISMSVADRVLTNTTVSGRNPDPICLPLPGRISKFCGRVYNIGRKEQNFNACLGLELRSAEEIEAAMRLSCFRFGPEGLKLEPAQPLPVVEDEDSDDDDDDDDDDDNDYDYDDDDDDVLEDDSDEELVADDDDDDEESVEKPIKNKPKKKKNAPKRVTTAKPKRRKPSTTSKSPISTASNNQDKIVESTTVKEENFTIKDEDKSEENDVFDDINDAVVDTVEGAVDSGESSGESSEER
ncbi:coiled-coil domain-containing protein 1-like [Euwallacea similis]|uniref:coiled-coil domain-containing protein 1-like n=1 Tax=Euwallacea similis TaxID=1736056 RepID=UPI00344E3116